MANIQVRTAKDGTKSYRVLIRRRGQPLQTRTFTTMSDAKKWERDVESQIDKGKQFMTSPSKEKTVANMIDRYLEFNLPNESETSQASKKSQLAWWKEQVGHLKLSQLTAAVIVEKRDQLFAGKFQKHGKIKKYKPASVNRYVSALASVLTEAVYSWEWLEKHPTRGRRIKLTEDNERTRFLSEDEQVRLWKACTSEGVNPIIYDIVLLAITTGMRRDEIRELKWEHVRISQGWLYVEDPKNGERRQVPLHTHAIEMLKRRKEKVSDNPWVFPSEKVEGSFDFDTLFKKVNAQAKLKDFHFHDLRHTAASYLLMGGASLIDLQRILGHKTLDMVRRYAHLSKQHMEKVPEKLDSHLLIPVIEANND